MAVALITVHSETTGSTGSLSREPEAVPLRFGTRIMPIGAPMFVPSEGVSLRLTIVSGYQGTKATG